MITIHMKRTYFMALSLLVVFFSQSASRGQEVAVNSSNHLYSGVRIAYLTSSLTDCSFQYSPVDFCDERHVSEIKSALSTMKPNFNRSFIVITPTESEMDHMRSVLVIDVRTGIAYPLPIDGYSGFLHEKSRAKQNGKIQFVLNDNRLCITGGILVYRAIEEGTFCFKFENDRFVGHHTEYMYSN